MKNQSRKLNRENAALYLKMKNYLAEKRLVKSEFSRVCEDLLSMLLDTEERGERAEDIFPGGYEAFLDEVAASCAKETWLESLLSVLCWGAFVVCVVFLVAVAMIALWGEDDGEWVRGVRVCINADNLTGASVAAFVGACVSLFYHKLAFRRRRTYVYAVVAIIAVALGISALLDRLIGERLLILNWVAIMLIFLGVCLSAGGALFLVRRLERRKN